MTRDMTWQDVEVFGGYIRGLDDEGYIEVFNPEGEPLVLIEATALYEVLQRQFSKGTEN